MVIPPGKPPGPVTVIAENVGKEGKAFIVESRGGKRTKVSCGLKTSCCDGVVVYLLTSLF